MKMNCFAVALMGLLAVDAVSAVCLPCTGATGGAVCAKTNDGKLKQFANLCEMNRLNCIYNRKELSVFLSGPCPSTSPPAVVDKASIWSWLLKPLCGTCVGAATNSVCGKTALGKMETFPNMCSLQLKNCLAGSLAYTFVSNGVCGSVAAPAPVPATPVAPAPVPATPVVPAPVPATPVVPAPVPATPVVPAPVPAVGGVATHPNIGMINSPECGKIPVASKIFNGQDAGLQQQPGIVLLEISEPAVRQKYTCGGSIISPRYVLTAAHCATGFTTPVTILAVVGEYKISTSPDCAYVQGRMLCSPPTQRIALEQVIVHPSYNNDTTDSNDIALLRLSKSLDFSTASVKPVCLPVGPAEEKRLFDGEMLTVTGWGVTARGAVADTLQAAAVPGVTAQNCSETYGPKYPILESQFCAGGNSRDSCSGDSGSPILYTNLAGNKMIEYGLVSYGVICGGSTRSVPGVYTKVGYHMNWILDTIRP